MNWLNQNLILKCLRELSDRELQLRLWLSSEGEVSSFTEAVEQLFTDSGLEELLHSRKTGLGAAAEEALLSLEASLDQVNPHLEPQALIDSPQMTKVRKFALLALHSVVMSKRE